MILEIKAVGKDRESLSNPAGPLSRYLAVQVDKAYICCKHLCSSHKKYYNLNYVKQLHVFRYLQAHGNM